jgi:predicted RNase H-like HicB family nuclease
MRMQGFYTIEVHKADEDEKGFWVSVPALPGCFSRGDTYEQAVENAHEAIQCYLEAAIKRGEKVPEDTNHPTLIAVSVALPQVA